MLSVGGADTPSSVPVPAERSLIGVMEKSALSASASSQPRRSRVLPSSMHVSEGKLVTATSADLDGDGRVDGTDRELLLARWGSADRSADLNRDGVVDGEDLGVLLSAWSETAGPGEAVRP